MEKNAISKMERLFWVFSNVYCYKNSAGSKPFEEHAELDLNILCVPTSNAYVEHVFSIMNLTNTEIQLEQSKDSPQSGFLLTLWIVAQIRPTFWYISPKQLWSLLKALARDKYIFWDAANWNSLSSPTGAWCDGNP